MVKRKRRKSRSRTVNVSRYAVGHIPSRAFRRRKPKRRRPRRIKSKRLAKYRRQTRKQSRAMSKAFHIPTRHYTIAKGLTYEVARKRVVRLDRRDFRGFSYNPKTGRAAIC
jgi:hypothetical protein